MIRTRRLGDATVTNVVEYVGPTHDPAATFPDFDPAVLRRHAGWLAPAYWVPAMDRLVIAIQLWVVEVGDAVIVVDTGVGNRKPRPAARMNQLNTLTLAWLEAAGASRERVTHVVMTHLHGDHIGWNTVLEDGRWTPTFPNARYLAPKADYDYFLTQYQADPNGLGGPLADSLFPLRDAGLFGILDEGERVADVLRVAPAPGHTPGMVTLHLEAGGPPAVFSADVMHHPLQIVQPSWNTAFCIIPDQARATRAAFLADLAERGALFMPCHFPLPGCGYVRRQGESYVFEPEA